MENNELGSFRRKFFPVYNHEFKKVIPLNILMFLATATYGVLRAMKDAYIIPLQGASLIANVKLFGVIPFMVLFKLVYDFVNKNLGKNARVYFLIAYFALFFSLFAFVLRKCVDINPLDRETCKGVEEMGTAKLFRKIWPYVLFYVHAEAWGTFVLSVACWGFANQICSSEQAKRCYSTLSIGAALATIFAGLSAIYLASTVNLLLGMVVCFVLSFGIVYFFFSRKIKQNPEVYEVPKQTKKKKRAKLSFFKAIKAFMQLKETFYLLLICILVLSYAVNVNLFEACYKQLMKKIGDNTGNRHQFVTQVGGWQLVFIGCLSLVFVLFLATPIRRKGWRFTALVVPVVLLMGVVIFFGLLSYFGWKEIVASQTWIFYIGFAVVVFVKSSKYVFFDTTKESTYIPLDEETKVTGKSFVDGVCSRIGKALGSVIILGMTKWPLQWKILNSTSFLGGAIFVIVTCWLYGVIRLDQEHSRLLEVQSQNLKEKSENKTS